MNELDVTLTALFSGTALTSLLSGTAAIYNMQAPEGAALPYVVFNQQAGGDRNLTPSRMKEYVYQVQCYAPTLAQAWAIDAAIDSLLHGVTLSVSGWTNWDTRKIAELPIPETLANREVVQSVRSLYRFELGV